MKDLDENCKLNKWIHFSVLILFHLTRYFSLAELLRQPDFYLAHRPFVRPALNFCFRSIADGRISVSLCTHIVISP